jgi:hypothetical protein
MSQTRSWMWDTIFSWQQIRRMGDITSRGLVHRYLCFGRNCCHYLPVFSTSNMDAESSSERFVTFYRTTHRHVQNDNNLEAAEWWKNCDVVETTKVCKTRTWQKRQSGQNHCNTRTCYFSTDILIVLSYVNLKGAQLQSMLLLRQLRYW